MAFGITPTGFDKKTFDDDIKPELEAEAKKPENFSADVDLSNFSDIGIFIKIFGKRFEEKWDVLEDIYFQNQIDNATGVQLDRVIALKGIPRLLAQKAIVTLTFGGTPASSITTAMIVQTAQGIQFQVTVGGSIGGGGTVDLQARAIVAGSSGNVPAGSIDEINTPAAGVDTVTNNEDSLGGNPIEEDDEYRDRAKIEGQEGNFSASQLQKALLDVESVLFAKVFQNVEDFPVGLLPAHSINPVIEGGIPSELFDIFLLFVPMGIQSVGAQNVDGLDSEGVFRSFNFDIPVFVDIFIDVQLQTDGTITPVNWLKENEDLTKRKIIQLVGGSIGAEVFPGQGIGVDVESFKIVGSISDSPQIIGEIIVDVGKSASPSGSRVDLTEKERGRTEEAKINLIVS